MITSVIETETRWLISLAKNLLDIHNEQVSIQKKLFRKLRKFSAKNIQNMISLSRYILAKKCVEVDSKTVDIWWQKFVMDDILSNIFPREISRSCMIMIFLLQERAETILGWFQKAQVYVVAME